MGRTKPHNILLSVLLLTTACMVGACDDGLPAPPATVPVRPPTPVPVSVVATVYPLADVARRVGGPYADVAWWIESGQTLDRFDPSPQQLDRLMKAGVVLSGGVGEEFATRHFDSGGFNDRRLIRLDAFVASDQRGAAQQWLDPRAVREAVTALAHQLSIIKPDAATQFRELAGIQIKAIDTLIDDFAVRLSGLNGRVAVSVGRDYSPLGRVAQMQVISVGDQPAVQLTDEQLRRIGSRISDLGAIMMLVESDTPPAVLRSLGERIRVPVVTIDSLGSSSSAGRDSYDKLMRYNFDQLYDGWRRAMGG